MKAPVVMKRRHFVPSAIRREQQVVVDRLQRERQLTRRRRRQAETKQQVRELLHVADLAMLRKLAAEAKVVGRSKMNRAQLVEALSK